MPSPCRPYDNWEQVRARGGGDGVFTGCIASMLLHRSQTNKRSLCWLSPVQVMFDARNKQFDTVMAALGSNSERWGIFTVSLEFERQASSEGGAP